MAQAPEQIPETSRHATRTGEWAALKGWSGDDHAAAFATFHELQAISQQRVGSATQTYLRRSLSHLPARSGYKIASVAEARISFEENFPTGTDSQPGEINRAPHRYYEPIVDGSRFPSQNSTGRSTAAHDLLVNGKKPGARVSRTVPPWAGSPPTIRYSRIRRLAIENGALDGQHLEICWLRDPLEAMSIEIEGSVRIRLEDGTLLRLAYDAHNGFNYSPIGSYRAIGRVLAERKLIPRQEISTEPHQTVDAGQSEQAKEVRGTNRSLVFFRNHRLDMEDEPAGGRGAAQVLGARSQSTPRPMVYGTPCFIEGELPIANGKADARFPRLMSRRIAARRLSVPPARIFTWGRAMPPAGSPALIRQQGRSRCCFLANSTWLRLAKRCRCRSRSPTMVRPKGEGGQAQVLPRDVPSRRKRRPLVKARYRSRSKVEVTSKRLSSFLSKRQPTGKGAPARS